MRKRGGDPRTGMQLGEYNEGIPIATIRASLPPGLVARLGWSVRGLIAVRPGLTGKETCMRNLKRILVSDIHACAGPAVNPAVGKHPYGWLSPAEAQRMGEFLRSDTVRECDELFMVGDVLDVWTCPHDVPPPTALDIINAPHNRPMIDGLREFAALPGKRVFYLRGNHDSWVTADDVKQLAPSIIFGPHYEEYPLFVRHGHEATLFNADDPAGRPFPFGYFLTRFTATAAERGLPETCLSFRTILKNGREVARLFQKKPLSECVFDVVARETGMKLEDRVIMPDGSAIEVGNVREMYQNLVAEWNAHRSTNAINAVMNEFDPFYSFSVGRPHVVILGHSHEHDFSWGSAYGMYLNLGSWCGGKAFFAKTWLENAGSSSEILCGQVFRWEPGTGPCDPSPHAGIPTGGRTRPIQVG